MNPKLKEINELIDLCDQMLDCVRKTGYIRTYEPAYQSYSRLVDKFCDNYKLADKNFAPYAILKKYWTNSGNCTLYMSEVEIIKKTLLLIKHDFFQDNYEKIFISHREKDAEQVHAFVDLLHTIGIPLQTTEASKGVIFCTSHPEGYIQNGERNLDTIRDMINTDEHVFYVLWYTDRYFESPACLNEAGAIWAMKKKYQEILVPNFDSGKIKGLLDKQPVWFRANDKMRLNSFKEQIEKMFALTPIAPNVWESARDKFIQFIQAKTKEPSSCSQ